MPTHSDLPTGIGGQRPGWWKTGINGDVLVYVWRWWWCLVLFVYEIAFLTLRGGPRRLGLCWPQTQGLLKCWPPRNCWLHCYLYRGRVRLIEVCKLVLVCLQLMFCWVTELSQEWKCSVAWSWPNVSSCSSESAARVALLGPQQASGVRFCTEPTTWGWVIPPTQGRSEHGGAMAVLLPRIMGCISLLLPTRWPEMSLSNKPS